VFPSGVVGWAALLGVATLVASEPHPHAAMSAIALMVYGAGSIICHQLPDRSFFLWSAQMPVCARCTGIYAGAALAAAALLTRIRARSRDGRQGASVRTRGLMAPPLPATTMRWIVGLAALPTVATLVVEWTAWMAPSNGSRALAGIPLGAAVSWVIGTVLAEHRHGAPGTAASSFPR